MRKGAQATGMQRAPPLPAPPASRTGPPAGPVAAVGREAETSDLVSKMLSRRIKYNVAVVGHRRIGKTTILRRAMHELAGHNNVAVAYFDVRENMAEPRRLLGSLANTILDAYMSAKRPRPGSAAPHGDRILRLAGRATAALLSKGIKSVELGVGGEGAVTARLADDEDSQDYGRLLASVLGSASALAAKDRLRFIVVIDEFQDLAALSRYPGLKDIFAILCGAIGDGGPNVSFVVGGSHARLSEAILGGSPSSARFYTLRIGDMDEAGSALLFKKHVQSKGMVGGAGARGGPPAAAVARAAAAAYGLVGGHPYYLLALAEAWDGRANMKSTYRRSLEPPLGLLHLYCEYVLSEDISSAVKSPLSRAMLETVAAAGDGGGIPTYSAMAKALSYRIERLPRYVRPLVDADLLDDGGGFSVRDRVLRDYLRACAERRGAARDAAGRAAAPADTFNTAGAAARA